MMVNIIKNCMICCDWLIHLFSLLRHPNILTLVLNFYAEEVIVEHLTGSCWSFQSESNPFFFPAFFCWLSLKLSPMLLHSYVYCWTRHKAYCKLVFRVNAGEEQLEHLQGRIPLYGTVGRAQVSHVTFRMYIFQKDFTEKIAVLGSCCLLCCSL